MHFDRVLMINRKSISRGKSKMRTVQRVIMGEKYRRVEIKKKQFVFIIEYMNKSFSVYST